jgi:mannosyltransferase OCH1-like enzyme
MLSTIAFENQSHMGKILCRGKACAEIGVARGNFSKQILRASPKSLLLVDPWKHQDQSVYPAEDNANVDDKAFGMMYKKVCSSFGGNKRVLIRKDFSKNVASQTEDQSLDFVYIDAIHTKEAVLEDMKAWWPKIAPGGWLCGHGYSGKHGKEVATAVHEFLKIIGLDFLDATTKEPHDGWATRWTTKIRSNRLIPEIVHQIRMGNKSNDKRDPNWAIRKRGKRLIPEIVHQIWVGNNPINDTLIRSMKTWETSNPSWQRWLWTDRDISVPGWTTKPISSFSMTNKKHYDRLTKPPRKSNILRMELIYKFGGIYSDNDVDVQKDLSFLLDGLSSFGSNFCNISEHPEYECGTNNAIFGSVAGEKWLADAINLIPSRDVDNRAWGPKLVSDVCKNHPEVLCFEPWVMSPYRWDEPDKAKSIYPDAWMIHRWAKNW